MSRRTPSPETLNAYVDGELSAGEAAAVARAVSEDRALAHKVAVLTRLKAMVQEGAVEQDPPIQVPKPIEHGGPAPRWPLLAAAAALVLVIGGALFFAMPLGQPSEPAWLEQAWAQHRDWPAAAATEPGNLDPAAPALPRRVALGTELVLPDFELLDLGAARLRLAFARPLDLGDDKRGLHIGYRGNRGCQISLFIFDGPEILDQALATLGEAPTMARGWRIGDRAHVLLAEGMDPQRFALIARSLYKATREAAPFDGETRTALAKSRAESRPCVG